MEFVKGKPKGTNPAIMGNPIDMYAVNGSKNNQLNFQLLMSFITIRVDVITIRVDVILVGLTIIHYADSY